MGLSLSKGNHYAALCLTTTAWSRGTNQIFFPTVSRVTDCSQEDEEESGHHGLASKGATRTDRSSINTPKPIPDQQPHHLPSYQTPNVTALNLHFLLWVHLYMSAWMLSTSPCTPGSLTAPKTRAGKQGDLRCVSCSSKSSG